MTPSKTDAWMPLWIGAYLADTMHLSRDEHGGYLLLLMAYWRNRGPLPDDDRRLAAICRATPAEWKSLRESLSEFFDIDGGTWTHGRCERELIDASARRSKASEKASSGGETRWGSTETKGRHLRSKRLAEAREKGTHTELQWSLMKEFHEHRCVRCGADGEIVKDHIAPIYQGGSDGIDNIQPLCRRCNASKGPEAKDFRKPDWNAFLGRQQEGIQEGARRLPDACSTPSPTPSSSLRSEEKETSLRLVVPDGVEDPPNGEREGVPDCPVKGVVDLYHEVLPELPRVERITEARRASIRQRWREWAAEKHWQSQQEGLDEWRLFFGYVRQSRFLMGQVQPANGRQLFVADLEWLMRPSNHVKVFEGRYHDAQG